MNAKKLLLWVLLLCMCILTGCGYAGPEKAVRRELDLIRELDESTIKAFVSYEDIKFASSSSPEIGPEATEAIKLFFKNFKYRIRSSSVSEDGTQATVTLSITNIDAHALAKDLCMATIERAAAGGTSYEQEGITSSFALMKNCLEQHTYPMVTTETSVDLVNQDGEWVIPESTAFEDGLTGGLVSYLQDPYLLTPEEVLNCTLAPFSSFSAKEWQTYLGLQDVFSTGSDLAGEIDLALCQQIARFFSYEIEDVTVSGDTADVTVGITSLDMQSVLNECRNDLLDYARTTESIRASDEEITQKTASLLLEALTVNEQSSTHTVAVEMINNGYTWEVRPDELFSSALLGGVYSAMELFE